MKYWLYTFAASFGLVIGSFLNVCIIRIPEHRFFKDRRSVCPQCGTIIPWYLNIPVFSYLLLKGQSSCCKKRISLMYPLVEILTAVGFVLVFIKFPFLEFGPLGVHIEPLTFIQFSHLLIFTLLMIVISFIDLRLMIIPDVISIPMILFSPFWIYFHPHLNWVNSLMGILMGGGVLYGIAWLYYLVRKQYGLGFGDVKMLAGIGGWLGYEAIFPTLLFGSVIGAMIGITLMVFDKSRGMSSKLPFGPFLAGGALIHMTYGREILNYLMLWTI